MERLQKQLGEYRLLARIAKGGQSEVFLAARSGPYGFFRPVVIKALPADFKGKRDLEALFYQEASISSRFSHPNVVTAHDAKWVGEEHFIVMDYVAGQTVADLAQRSFKTGHGLTVEETLVMMADACHGLDYVHSFEDVDCSQYSLVHCDISPQNLMVTYGGVTRVFDFGISQVSGDVGWMSTELVGGKYSYMSPEQCLKEKLDHRSDIFSLGIIFYELAARRRLFRRKGGKEEVIKAVTEEPIEAPHMVADHLDEEIGEVIMKALARPREQRYSSAGEMAERVEAILERRGVDQEVVRLQLGEKVKDLFSEERDEVAETLRQAREVMSEQVAAPQPEFPDIEAARQREEDLTEELTEAAESMEELRVSAARATEVASALTEEVTALQKRQNWFIAGMLALSLIALAVAAMAYISHQGNFVAGEPTTASTSTSPPSGSGD